MFKKSLYSLILNVEGKKILFNSVYGTVDQIDNSVAEKWNKENPDWSQEELTYLIDRGHISTSEEEEDIKSKMIMRDTSSSNHKSKFYLVFSYLCNFSCFYCFENNIEQQKVMSDDELRCSFDAMLRIVALNQTDDNEIVLFGGEPLLERNRSLVEQTYDFAERNKFKVAVITNGSNVIAFSDLLLRYKHTISSFSITIDGTEEVHNSRRAYKNRARSYVDILKGISFLMQQDIPVSIRMNIDRGFTCSINQALEELQCKLGMMPPVSISLVDDTTCTGCDSLYSYRETAEILKKCGYFDKIFGNALTIDVKPIAQIEALLSGKSVIPRFRYCRMSELYLFSTNGNIYVCPQSCENNEFLVGTYWPTVAIKADDIVAQHSHSSFMIDDCSKCALSPICGGGCYVKRSYHRVAKGKAPCYYDDLIQTLEYLINELIVNSH